MTRGADAVRAAALGGYGALRFLRRVQGGVEDIEGAVDQGQYGVAAYMARTVALLCLSIRSLAHGADIDLDEESVSFDYFARVPDNEVAAAIALANQALDIDGVTAGAWLDRFRAYVGETERLLGYDNPLPLLRSPEGAFGLIGIARRWTPVLEQLGLPPVLPSRWAVPRQGGAP
jgi:hypothetical protein